MTSFLERYRRGEREPVWRELAALGAAVREAPYRDDALAVVRETMERVRRNAELLTERLRELGYAFAYPDRALVPPSEGALAILDRLERRAGPLPLSLRAFHETVGSVNWMGAYPGLSAYVAPADPSHMMETVRDAFAQLFGDVPKPDPAADPLADPRIANSPLGAQLAANPALADVMRQMSQLARALMGKATEAREDAARMTEGGAASERLARTHGFAEDLHARLQRAAAEQSAGEDVVSDPLVVESLHSDDPDDYRDFVDGDEEYDEDDVHGDPEGEEPDGDASRARRYAFAVAPDAGHKAGYGGGDPYLIRFPNPAADAELEGTGVTFVEHLRESFRWGGFPGLANRPAPGELARLTEGLLPI